MDVQIQDTAATSARCTRESSNTSKITAGTADCTGRSDWTDTYSFWSNWEDTDEVERLQQESEAKLRSNAMDQSSSFMGHDHDHSVERKLLDLSEPDKMSHCERHRLKGNYLFLESMFPNAAEQYQLALSYYEYCFPDNDEAQTSLDDLRYACLCNISLCYYRMGHWRMAVSTATQVIEEDADNVKALFRRSQAYRALDEYGLAESDILKASRLCPADNGIQREIKALQLQKKSALIAERDLAVNMLRENSSSGSNSSSSQNYLSQDSKLNQDSRDSSSCNGFPQKIFSDSNRGARLTNECTDKFNLFEAILPLEPCLPHMMHGDYY